MVLGASSLVLGPSLVHRPWCVRHDGLRTEDQERTEHQEPSTKDRARHAFQKARYPKVVNRLPDAYRRRPRSKTSAARRRYAIATASRIITFVNDGACRIRTGR